jgi:hypothetical protein
LSWPRAKIIANLTAQEKFPSTSPSKSAYSLFVVRSVKDESPNAVELLHLAKVPGQGSLADFLAVENIQPNPTGTVFLVVAKSSHTKRTFC